MCDVSNSQTANLTTFCTLYQLSQSRFRSSQPDIINNGNKRGDVGIT